MQNDLEAGLACFNRGEFFEAHEFWEQVWLRLKPHPGLQAMILFCGVGVLVQKSRFDAATRMLLRARDVFTEAGARRSPPLETALEVLAHTLIEAAATGESKFVLEALGCFQAKLDANGLPRLELAKSLDQT
jgi:hypothetical protein